MFRRESGSDAPLSLLAGSARAIAISRRRRSRAMPLCSRTGARDSRQAQRGSFKKFIEEFAMFAGELFKLPNG